MAWKVKERETVILKYLSGHSTASVKELSALCGVSQITVRRELQALEEANKVVRFHGGAQLKHPAPAPDVTQFDSKAFEMQDEKQRIGAKACEYVSDGETVFMNSGTTVLAFLRQLRKKDVTVVTNNTAAAASRTGKDITLLLVGGFYQERTRSVCGDIATGSIRDVYSNCTILGANAIDVNAGVTTGSPYESDINSAMIANSRGKVIILADHTKMGRIANYRSAALQQIDIIITDRDCPPAIAESLRSAGVQVELV